MPIPRPRAGEAKDEFISRCMSNATMVDEYGQDQRYAICNQAWEDRRSVSSSMKIIPTAHANVRTRMESLDGRSHVVVPMVAMVEGVHCGSKGCDLYLKEELGKFVEAWNGVPIPVMHPQRGDEYISANIPEVLETQVVGRFFNARFEEGKLKGEAWIDIEKAKSIYPDLLTMLNSSARLEVSTGLWSDDEVVEGEWNGERYEAIVRNIRPDHIALLPGAEGACSWEDGCGVRANQDKKGGEGMNVDEVVGELENKAGGKGKIREFFGILAKKLGFRAQELSHDEIRSKLQEEVDKLDVPPSESPSILHYVVDVFDDYFVYEKRQSDGDSELYKQEFEVQEDGSVALKGQPEKVMKNVEYVRAQGKVVANFDKKPKTGQGGEQMGCCEEKIQALIESGKFAEEEREWLSTLEEDKIDKLLALAEEKKDDADPASQPKDEPKDDPTANQQQATGDGGDSATGDAEPKDKKPLDVNQFLETVPAEFREVLESGVKMHRERKESLVKAILANERNKFTQEYLQERSIDELEALAALAVRDYSARGIAEPPDDGAKVNVRRNDGTGVPEMPKMFAQDNK